MGSGQLYPMLVIDAGNSSVKFAKVTRAGAVPRIVATVAADKLTVSRVRALTRQAQASTAVASCVVPRLAKILRAGCARLVLIGPTTLLPFVTDVDRRTVGADRLANMAEAVRRFGRNVVVADFGTAATFDVLDHRGHFAGGAIAPGLRTLAVTLTDKAAQLPEIDLAVPKSLVGRTTHEALRAGVCGGYAGLVGHLVSHLGSGRKRVVFTGGDAALVAKLTGLKVVVDPLWTLKGLAVLAALNAREASK
jgi:type III pantothenate kinase